MLESYVDSLTSLVSVYYSVLARLWKWMRLVHLQEQVAYDTIASALSTCTNTTYVQQTVLGEIGSLIGFYYTLMYESNLVLQIRL